MKDGGILPRAAQARKDAPIARGLLDYFPHACAAVAELSRIGNEQHNPGQPMHWSREKSSDHADCIVRHLIDRGSLDVDGVLHDVKVAWRALAMAQLALEKLAFDKIQAENHCACDDHTCNRGSVGQGVCCRRPGASPVTGRSYKPGDLIPADAIGTILHEAEGRLLRR